MLVQLDHPEALSDLGVLGEHGEHACARRRAIVMEVQEVASSKYSVANVIAL
jgi:hypothetical protein